MIQVFESILIPIMNRDGQLEAIRTFNGEYFLTLQSETYFSEPMEKVATMRISKETYEHLLKDCCNNRNPTEKR